MRIYVTKKDIELGVPRSIEECPISLAIKRRFKGSVAVSTYSHVAYVHNNMKYRRFTLPNKATIFVNAFDGGKSVKPFRFTLT
jgi:hypothetical protein